MSKQYSAPHEIQIDLSKSYSARLDTNHGVIEFDLLAETISDRREQLRGSGA